jgi:hypothetical protein
MRKSRPAQRREDPSPPAEMNRPGSPAPRRETLKAQKATINAIWSSPAPKLWQETGSQRRTISSTPSTISGRWRRMRIRNSKPGCFVPIALALPKVHKEGTSDAQQIANPTGTRPRAANGIFSNRERQRAPVLQREDEVYNAAASVAISPPTLERDREDGSRLFGEWNR